MNCDSVTVKARSWAGQIGKRQPAAAAASGSSSHVAAWVWLSPAAADVGLARSSWVRTQGLSRSRLALCLSPSRRSRRLGDTVSLRLALSLVALASGSPNFPFFFFFFLFFPLVFAFSVGFGLLRLRFFLFFFSIFFFFFGCGLTWVMALWALLCSELAG